MSQTGLYVGIQGQDSHLAFNLLVVLNTEKKEEPQKK